MKLNNKDDLIKLGRRLKAIKESFDENISVKLYINSDLEVYVVAIVGDFNSLDLEPEEETPRSNVHNPLSSAQVNKKGFTDYYFG